MKHLQSKPYFLFLPLIIFLIIVSFFDYGSFDFHLSDTYIVFTNNIFYYFFAFCSLILFLLYMFTRKILFSSLLVWLHVLFTIGLILIIIKLNIREEGFAGMPRRYYDYSDWDTSFLFRSLSGKIKTFIICIALLIIVQLLFFANIAIGALKFTNRMNNQ